MEILHLLWLLGFPHVEKEEDQGVETKEEELMDSMMGVGVGGGQLEEEEWRGSEGGEQDEKGEKRKKTTIDIV